MDSPHLHDQQQSSSADGEQQQPVWQLLDRHDPLWKQLYSLDRPGSTPGRSAGLDFSERNRKLAQGRRVDARAQAAAAAERAVALAKQQAKAKPKQQLVRVPHFRPQQQQQPSDPLATVPRRRSAQAISAALAADDAVRAGPPAPSGRLIDEREKERFALVMQFAGAVPCAARELTPAGQARIQAQARRSSAPVATAAGGGAAGQGSTCILAAQRAVLQQRFGDLEAEVQDRAEFIGTMQAAGALTGQQLQAVRAEAAAKVAEMRSCHARLRQMDA